MFEADHPATQTWKRERLAAAGIDPPPDVTFVSVDFERQSLSERLAAAAFQLGEPAFFSCLGVTPYLTERSFGETIAFVAARPPGSGIVFDYSVPGESLNPVQVRALAALSARVEAMGEPLRLFFDPAQLLARLRQIGFVQVEDIGREEMNQRYFAQRADGLRVKTNLARLISAGV